MNEEEYPDDYIVDDSYDGSAPPPFEPDEELDGETPVDDIELVTPDIPPLAALGKNNESWRRWAEDNILKALQGLGGVSKQTRVLTDAQIGIAAQVEDQGEVVGAAAETAATVSEIIVANEAPAVPTDPILESSVGQVTVIWDGKLYQVNTDGNLSPRPPGAGFKGVIVEMSEVQPATPPTEPVPEPEDDPEGPEDDTNLVEDGGIFDPENDGGVPEGEWDEEEMVFPDPDDGDAEPGPEEDVWVDPTPWVQVGQTLNASGTVVVNPPPNSIRWFRLVSLDFQDRRSEGSTPVAVTVVPTTMTDLDIAVQDHINDAWNMGDEALDKVVNSIATSVDEYVVSDSNVIPPGPLEPWSSDTPDWSPGQYVWRRTRTTTIGGTVAVGAPVVVTGNDGTPGEDAVFMRVLSDNGNAFKHSEVATTLRATVIKGSTQITNLTDLRAVFGNNAYLEWKWQRNGETTWSVISSADPRIGNAGFTFTVSPADVNERTSFQCNLMT